MRRLKASSRHLSVSELEDKISEHAMKQRQMCLIILSVFTTGKDVIRRWAISAQWSLKTGR
jgi:hypothetical protein